MEDEQHSGRLQMSTTGDNVEQVRTVVEEDRRRTCQDIENVTGIPHSTIYCILVDVLMKKKIFAKWVPHLLNGDQQEEQVHLCCANLHRFCHEGQDFLSHIVTGDETWVYSWDPELKRQSAQWCNQGSPHPKKARCKQGAMKVRSFSLMQQVLVNWAVPAGTTINAAYYKWVLQEKLHPAIRKKWPGLVEYGLIFHHNNAPVHMAILVMDLLDNWDWELLGQPRYSPNLAPTDFYLFPKMRDFTQETFWVHG